MMDEISKGLLDLSGRTALVTGGSRGPGQAFGRALARAGANLIVTSRKKNDLSTFITEIEAMGRKALPLELDVRDEGSITRMGEALEAARRQVHILVNNAGCNVRKPALEVTWDDWNLVVETLREAKAELLMKGSLHTDELIAAVVSREGGDCAQTAGSATCLSWISPHITRCCS